MLTRKQIQALKWAVEQAESWRGSMTGNPDPEPLEAFDKQVADAKGALKAIKDRIKSDKEAQATPEEVQAARNEYAVGSDDNIEVDDNAQASRGDDGTWVAGWLFLSNKES